MCRVEPWPVLALERSQTAKGVSSIGSATSSVAEPTFLQSPIGPSQWRALIVSGQDRDLVPQHEALGVLGRIGSGEQHEPAQHASEHELGESEGHGD